MVDDSPMPLAELHLLLNLNLTYLDQNEANRLQPAGKKPEVLAAARKAAQYSRDHRLKCKWRGLCSRLPSQAV